MVFRKGGMLPRNLSFTFDDAVIEIITKITYLGVVFISVGSFYRKSKHLSWTG